MGLDQFVWCNSKKVKRDAERAMDEHSRDWYHDSWYTMYWRKANAVHKWFVDNCWYGEYDEYDGHYLNVSVEQLFELRDACQKVLDSSKLVKKEVMVSKTVRVADDDDGSWDVIDVPEMMTVLEDDSVAKELLPTAAGFFFGTYRYDEWYIEDLKHTVDAINAATENLVKLEPDEKHIFPSWVHKDEQDWKVVFLYDASW